KTGQRRRAAAVVVFLQNDRLEPRLAQADDGDSVGKPPQCVIEGSSLGRDRTDRQHGSGEIQRCEPSMNPPCCPHWHLTGLSPMDAGTMAADHPGRCSGWWCSASPRCCPSWSC